MKLKRILCVLLTVATMFTMIFAAFGTSVSAITKISNTSPCITADVGKTIDLSGYSLVFDCDSSATASLTWKDASGNVITNFTPNEKGVTPLTAEADGKTKTVYVVAKEESESEYVLFEIDFSKYNNISELKDLGFTTNKQDGFYSFKNGELVLGNNADDYTRLILPQWLGDFGDYSIITEAKFITVVNNSRWFGIVFRAQNENGQAYPYYHFCTRDNTTASNGIEFAERNKTNAWNVCEKKAGLVASLSTDYHTFNVQAFGNNIQYNIDGSEALYVTEAIVGIKAPNYKKGLIGITMNCGTMAMKNIKITVQENNPKRPYKNLVLIDNKHENNNLRNPIANVQLISGDIDAQLNSMKNVGVALFNASDVSDMNQVLKTAKKKRIVPTIHITSNEEADKVLDAITSSNVRDVNAVSESKEVLGYIRGKSAFVRTGLIVDLQSSTLDSKAANTIRENVRSAPATFCIIKSTNASKQAVAELQELAVAVWVQVDSEPNTDEYVTEAAKAITSGANGIISASANALTDVINNNFAEFAMTRTPIMIGHRGNPTQAPENSLSGFITAYENGCDIFEVDVEITSDGEIIIMHDNTLNRTTNYDGKKTVNQMTLAEVQEYYLLDRNNKVTDEKVPTLKQVLEEFKDKDCRIFVEFKGSNAANVPATAKIIKEMGMEDKVDVISFSGNFLQQTQKEIPGMSTGFLSSYKFTSTTYQDAVEALMRALNDAQKYNSTINTGSPVFTVHFEQAATDRGITVWPWTYTASGNNGAFLSACDGLTTDDVQWAKDMAKFIQSDVYDISIEANGTAQITISSETYGGAVTEISSDKLIVSVLTGKDLVRVENGNIIGVEGGNGVATVVYGYPTTTTDGGEYVLYTQPITINVSSNNETTSDEQSVQPEQEEQNNSTWIIVVVAIAVVAAAAVAFVLIKKKK